MKRKMKFFYYDGALIRAKLDQEEWTPSWEDDGQEARSVYLGSMPWPSGKYYTPWANSNVNPCPRCGGTGHGRHTIKCKRCDGTGWRSVAHLAELRHESFSETVAFLESNRPGCLNENHSQFKCWSCNGSGRENTTCRMCGGLGSEEAYQDQIWWEEAEMVGEKYDFSVECGEGDPTDVFAVEYRDSDKCRDEDEEEDDGERLA